MNERIRQLALQAISEVDYIRDDEFTNMELQKMYIPDCFSEKFAELIAQDAVLSEREACAKVADRQNGDDEQDPESCVWSKAARHIAAAIRARGSE